MNSWEPVEIGARNPQLKRLRRLVRRPKARSEERAFVVDGPTLVVEALEQGAPVTQVFCGNGTLAGSPELVAALDRASGRADGPTVMVADPSVLADVLDPVNARPVAAVVSMGEPVDRSDGSDRHLLATVEVRDPGNLGTMIRTAEASGAAALVVVGDSVDPWSPKVVRSSAGSVLRLPLIVLDSVASLVSLAAAEKRSLLAAVISDDAVDYDEYDLHRAILMVGNEPHGLSPSAVAAGDGQVTIPLNEAVESLNVAAAAAVLCFEAARQRRRRSAPNRST